MKIIWIIGSMGSGKTTQNKNLMKILGGGVEFEVCTGETNGIAFMFSKIGRIASLGLLKEGVQTCGIDPVYSKLKKEGLLLSLQKCREDKMDYVIIEGAQCSLEWWKQVIEPFMDIRKDSLFVFHLAIGFEDNLRRIRQRRWLKQYPDLSGFCSDAIQLEDRTYVNVLGKNKQYVSLFSKLDKIISPLSISLTEIDAMLEPEEITSMILNKMFSN